MSPTGAALNRLFHFSDPLDVFFDPVDEARKRIRVIHKGATKHGPKYFELVGVKERKWQSI